MGIFFATFSGLGFYLVYRYGHGTKKFELYKFALMLLAPIICVIITAAIYGPKVLLFFCESAVIGTSLEYLFGYSYYKTFGRRFWMYERYSLGGFTSYLSIPIWGVAGVIFWLLSRTILR